MLTEVILTDVYDPGGNIWTYAIRITNFGAIDITQRYRDVDEERPALCVFPDHWPGLIQKINEMLSCTKEINDEARRVCSRE